MTDVTVISEQENLTHLINTGVDVVVKFTAPARCRPCQQFAPHFEGAAQKSDAIFVSVNVDDSPWAVVEYGIKGIPTVMMYRDGEYLKNLQERRLLPLVNEILDA